ncbi:shikimate dehydrogenase family protein [Pedobacter boryungensis]|uniref:Shikimate dehydrogenase n=1 Tax=Pedobacter boryungensis TaxID=869962 RepID=A0ABX2DIF7_9SPHI|nr:shikimate dehydrogenase [Pedobacter boryungensis]NQX32899.1 shikimate dehydrogenase [Pedobacter boryungensis]
MRTFGLIGFPLSHSFSKKFFSEKFENEKIADCSYELFPIENTNDIQDLIAANPSLCGLNVTIPHKVNVIPFLNEIDDAAEEIGAVNCISINQNDDKLKLRGYNTDAYGFSESLKPLLEKHHQKALIFGDGGAAKAVKYVLNQLGISYLVVVRNPAPNAILYSAITKEILNEYTILINTTPLGMLPNLDSYPPIPYQFLTAQHLAYDLVYNPEETEFLKKAKNQGAKIKNGLEMLFLQAERSWYIWNS